MTNANKSVFKAALDYKPGQFTQVLATIAKQKVLLVMVKKALPSELAEQVKHCVHSGKRLLVYTENANWAAQIRFYNETILSKILATGGININKVQIKLLTSHAVPVSRVSARLPSIQNIDQISRLVAENSNNDELKRSLARLAKTLEKKALNLSSEG